MIRTACVKKSRFKCIVIYIFDHMVFLAEIPHVIFPLNFDIIIMRHSRSALVAELQFKRPERLDKGDIAVA